MSIVTLQSFKDYVRDEAQGVNDALLSSFLDAAIAGFGNACQRELTLVDGGTAAAPRVFAADWRSDVLRINDCTTVTTVVENSVTLASTLYQLEPLNNKTMSGAYAPYTQIRRLHSWWYSDQGRAAITITAKWGWASIPAQITEAIKALGKEICNNQDVRLGIVAVSDAAISGIRSNKVVRDAVNDYLRAEAIGVA